MRELHLQLQQYLVSDDTGEKEREKEEEGEDQTEGMRGDGGRRKES